jgi:hypothetical protein
MLLPRRTRAPIALALLMLASGLGRLPPALEAAPWVPPPFSTLRAGGFNTITHQLPINIVFVGYEENAGPRDITRQDFLAALSATSCTRNRVPAFYGNAPTGLCFEFAYDIVFADQAFEDALFAHLAGLARPAPRTPYQDQYNAQAVRSLSVTENHRIDAAAVEAPTRAVVCGSTICPPGRRGGRPTGISWTRISMPMTCPTTACRRSGNTATSRAIVRSTI